MPWARATATGNADGRRLIHDHQGPVWAAGDVDHFGQQGAQRRLVVGDPAVDDPSTVAIQGNNVVIGFGDIQPTEHREPVPNRLP